jgi:hypothetical protein
MGFDVDDSLLSDVVGASLLSSYEAQGMVGF